MTRRRRALVGLSVLAVSVTAAGGVVAATQSSDEAALQPTRERGRPRDRAPRDSLLARMTLDEKLQQIQLLSDGQITDADAEGRRRRRCSASSTRRRSTTAAHRGRAVAAAHPDPVRLRHDPRLPHDLPDPARRGEQLRPGRRDRRRHDRRARVGRRRHQADLQPDGRRLARAALGPHRRGRAARTRTSAPCSPPPGSRPRRARDYSARRQGRHERQALRRVRPARGRPRLQHDRHVRAAAAQPLPAAVQGGDRRRRRTP